MSHERSLDRRKRWFLWLQRTSLTCTFLLIPALHLAQAVTFTKITSGGIVNTAATYWGGSWGDYDDDGWLDLFVAANSLSPTNFLYHNNHDGTFTLIDSAAMPKITSDQHGSAWADYDNDGHLDLIVTVDTSPLFVGGLVFNALYHNNGNGTFSGITTNAIYNDFYYTWTGSHAPKWGDYNNDGLIDLFIAGHDIRNRLFRNDGAGLFTRITNHVLVNDFANSEGGAWVDYDSDGDLDLFVANAFNPTLKNALYRNDQSGVFTKTTDSGLSASVEDSLASCWADYDNDGFLDLFLANHVKNSLHHNNGDGTFEKVLDSAVVEPVLPSLDYFFGTCAWADYDNDGALDLYYVSAAPPYYVGGDAFLYHNTGDGTFTKVTDNAITSADDAGFPSWVDYDNDGFMDLFLAHGAFDPVPHTNALYHNDGNANAWLNVKLVGTVSNRSAIGAKVRVEATYGGASHWQLREISGGEGQNIQPSLNAEFGLGNATTIDTLRIEWPSGIVQEFQNLAPRQFLTIVEVGGIDTDGDGIPDTTDNCPTVKNANQADGDTDLVGDLCDNCSGFSNVRVPGWTFALGGSAYLAANPWATLTGGQRDDDHDGFGNICDGDFAGALAVTSQDTSLYKNAIGCAKAADTCGVANCLGTLPCAKFDLNSANSTESSASGISAADTARYKLLIGQPVGPKCAACTGTGSVPLPCEAGTAGGCF